MLLSCNAKVYNLDKDITVSAAGPSPVQVNPESCYKKQRGSRITLKAPSISQLHHHQSGQRGRGQRGQNQGCVQIIECKGWRRHSSLIFLLLLFTKPYLEVSGWLFQTNTHFTHSVYQPFSRVSPPTFELYGSMAKFCKYFG